jgi:hypothetical protein
MRLLFGKLGWKILLKPLLRPVKARLPGVYGCFYTGNNNVLRPVRYGVLHIPFGAVGWSWLFLQTLKGNGSNTQRKKPSNKRAYEKMLSGFDRLTQLPSWFLHSPLL